MTTVTTVVETDEIGIRLAQQTFADIFPDKKALDLSPLLLIFLLAK
jgi:hypothetical protein